MGPDEWISFDGLIDQIRNEMTERDMDFDYMVKQIRKRMKERDDFDITSVESAVKKGRSNEHSAKDILSGVYGSTKVDKVQASYGDDVFKIVDVMVSRPGDSLLFVQVKTNDFAAGDRANYKNTIDRNINLDVADVEVWVRVDYQGWEIYSYENDNWVHQLDLPIDHDEAVEQARAFYRG